MMVAAVLAVVVVLAIGGLLGVREAKRRRIARELRIDTARGISEERFETIGGVEQWLQLRGDDRTNPVLLVLHGGPGSPYAVFTPLIRSWEKEFTVVQWDRRGAGHTRGRSGKAQPGDTFDRLVDDAAEVIDFLRGHLGVEKVTLLAGSMGTMVGVPLTMKRPDLVDALVLTDMYTDMRRNESVGYAKALDRVRAAGNRKAVAALEAIGADPARWDVRAWLTKMNWTMKTDPTTPNAVVKLLFPLAFASPLYRLRDAWQLLSGFQELQKLMYDEYAAYDAYRFGTRFEVPVVILQGDRDVLTITELAQEYFEAIEAPAKELALIGNASHFAAFTRPDAFLAELAPRCGRDGTLRTAA